MRVSTFDMEETSLDLRYPLGGFPPTATPRLWNLREWRHGALAAVAGMPATESDRGGTEMAEPRMPTTLPSPADRGEFRFAAVDGAGREWRWIDDEMVWTCIDTGRHEEPGKNEASVTVH